MKTLAKIGALAAIGWSIAAGGQPPASHIVVVADVHGAYPALVALLRRTGIVDEALEWSGGAATLVSLGDLVDRGADTRKTLDLFMRLQTAAPHAGGAVRVVLGNHELMNLTGDLRYVSAADYAEFADLEPDALRQEAFARFASRQTAPDTQTRAEFERLYPRGYFGRMRAFRPNGVYGAWLLQLPPVIVIGRTALVHGGLSELVASMPTAEIDRRVHDGLTRLLSLRDRLAAAGTLPTDDMRRDAELARAARLRISADAPAEQRELAALLDEFLAAADAPELGPASPMWYRGSVYCNPLLEGPILDAALRRLGAARVVVGHTPTEDRRARELYEGRLVMLDTGMLTDYYAGRPSALLVDGDDTFVQYLAPDERRPYEHGDTEAYGLTEEQILEALARGTLEPADGSVRSTRQVAHLGSRLRATFYPAAGRAADLELAAFALDRQLGLHLVPPTVAREVDGKAGALQLQYPAAMTEAERLRSGSTPGPWCPIGPQVELMRTFDELTNNPTRTQDDVVYSRELSVLHLIDHGHAFGTGDPVRRAEAPALPAALRVALAALDREGLAAAFDGRLDTQEIRALLARRDSILFGTSGK